MNCREFLRSGRRGPAFAEQARVGINTKFDHYTEADHLRFKERLDLGLRALAQVLKQPDFGRCQGSLGVELELSVVDATGRPLPIAPELVRAAHNPEITPEMGKFDIELSTPPVPCAGKPFSALRRAMRARVHEIERQAQRRNARVVPISILPTFRREDFHLGTITDMPRYRALARGLCEGRDAPFEIQISGDESLRLVSTEAVAMEAANTAFQMHVSTQPAEFVDMFNAASLLCGPMLAAAGNSPTFLGRSLWHETRIALFKQAGDDRAHADDADMLPPPRVKFGSGWVRDSVLELFMESVALHKPLLPECSDDPDPFDVLRAGQLPRLSELRLHHGTVWSWNRPVYDPDNGGNLRIELRAFPSGPSYDDMLANASFLFGCMRGLRARIPRLIASLPFALAARNFYAAAQFGLDAQLCWPSGTASTPQPIRARDLLLSLLPAAYEGLASVGVEAREAEHFLGVFEERVRSGQTGAVWQRQVLAQLEAQGMQKDEALACMLERYMSNFQSQRPVSSWPIEPSACPTLPRPRERWREAVDV